MVIQSMNFPNQQTNNSFQRNLYFNRTQWLNPFHWIRSHDRRQYKHGVKLIYDEAMERNAPLSVQCKESEEFCAWWDESHYVFAIIKSALLTTALMATCGSSYVEFHSIKTCWADDEAGHGMKPHQMELSYPRHTLRFTANWRSKFFLFFWIQVKRLDRQAFRGVTKATNDFVCVSSCCRSPKRQCFLLNFCDIRLGNVQKIKLIRLFVASN